MHHCKMFIGGDDDVDNEDDDDSACIREAVKFNASQLFRLNELQWIGRDS